MNNIGFSPKEKSEIAAYVDRNIPAELKDMGSEYYESVEQRISNLFNLRLKMIQEFVQKNKYVYYYELNFPLLDEDCVKVVKKIFLDKFQFTELCYKLEKYNVKGAFHSVFCLTNGEMFSLSLKVAWSPQNPHVYGSCVVANKLEFERNPGTVLDGLWKNAQAGVNTDLTFLCEDKIFHAHRTILTQNVEYFAVMFRSGFSESDKSNLINVPETPANAFEQFLRYNYLGTLKDLVYNDNVDLLLEVFLIAHIYSDVFLMNHVVELLKISFIKFKDDFDEKMTKLLKFICIFENLELMEIAVTMLEQSEFLVLVDILSVQNQYVFDFCRKNIQKSPQIIKALETIEIIRHNLNLEMC